MSKEDIVLEVLAQQFTDYLKYDKERWGAFEKKYEKDWQHSQEWRKAHWEKIETLTQLINEILPTYRRGIWGFWIIVSGSLLIVIKRFWGHIVWN